MIGAPCLRVDVGTKHIFLVRVRYLFRPKQQTFVPLDSEPYSDAAQGSRTMPPKRAASPETQAETQAVVKRYRQAIDEVAEEYVCPITAKLPIDPVMRWRPHHRRASN